MIVIYDKQTLEVTGWGRWLGWNPDLVCAENEDWIRIPE